VRILPAIDMMDGRCVRLKQGLASSKKEYESQPVRAALRWQSAGASWLHVVNLDGAFGQADANAHALTELLAAVNIPVQLGGGIRSLEDAARWLDLGVSRIILGTLAVADPGGVGQAVERFGADRVAVGADAKENRVAIKGWVEESEKQLLPFVAEMEALGVRHIIYTDISRDGGDTGPDLAGFAALCAQSSLNLIASGGFSKMEHFEQLEKLKCANLEGVIVGTALYEGLLDLATLIGRFERVR